MPSAAPAPTKMTADPINAHLLHENGVGASADVSGIINGRCSPTGTGADATTGVGLGVSHHGRSDHIVLKTDPKAVMAAAIAAQRATRTETDVGRLGMMSINITFRFVLKVSINVNGLQFDHRRPHRSIHTIRYHLDRLFHDLYPSC